MLISFSNWKFHPWQMLFRMHSNNGIIYLNIPINLLVLQTRSNTSTLFHAVPILIPDHIDSKYVYDEVIRVKSESERMFYITWYWSMILRTFKMGTLDLACLISLFVFINPIHAVVSTVCPFSPGLPSLELSICGYSTMAVGSVLKTFDDRYLKMIRGFQMFSWNSLDMFLYPFLYTTFYRQLLRSITNYPLFQYRFCNGYTRTDAVNY